MEPMTQVALNDSTHIDLARTFRMSNSLRNMGWIGLLVYGTFGLVVLGCVLTLPKVVPLFPAFVVISLGFPAAMCGFAAWLLVLHRKAALMIRGPELSWSGVFQSRTLDLRQVTRARWRGLAGYGGIRLDHAEGPFRIVLSNYNDGDWQTIVEHVRETVPIEVQEDWTLFAYRIARMRSRKELVKAGPGEKVVTRASLDRLFWPLAALGVAAALYGWWLKNDTRWLPLLLVAPLLWLCARHSIPRQGIVSMNLSTAATNQEARLLCFLALWFIVTVGAVTAISAFARNEDRDFLQLACVGVSCFVLLVEVWLMDREYKRREHEAAEAWASGKCLTGDSNDID